MFLQTNGSVIVGICLFAFGLLILSGKKLFSMLRLRAFAAKFGKKFPLAAGIMILLAGIYLVLCPLLSVMMGEDYWILFILGVIACCMLFILLLLH